jgi:formylglycine-generating enzyme required for sulfatase activity
MGKVYRYPVGDTPVGMNNNRSHHLSVKTTQKGVNGLFDMGGNVWECLADRREAEALTAGVRRLRDDNVSISDGELHSVS